MQFICAESKAPAAPVCFMLLVEHIWDRCNHATWGLMKDSRNVNMLNYSHMQIGCALNAIVPAWNTQVLLKERTSCFTYALAYVPYVVCIWTGNGELCCTGNPTFLPLRVTDLTRGFSSLQLFFYILFNTTDTKVSTPHARILWCEKKEFKIYHQVQLF